MFEPKYSLWDFWRELLIAGFSIWLGSTVALWVVKRLARFFSCLPSAVSEDGYLDRF